MIITLNVNQINYLLDTYFDENLYEVKEEFEKLLSLKD